MPPKTGSFRSDLPYAKDLLDFWLTRFPRLYVLLDRYRQWENWDKRVYLSLVRRGDIVFDIGANFGAHTVFLSHLVADHGKVLAFEPIPSNFERLRETVRQRARFSNIDVFQLAVGDPVLPNTRIVMKVPGDDFTQASSVAHTAGSWHAPSDIWEYSCTVTSLDAEVAARPLSRPDFIKIDVEGAELDTLKGGARTISKYRPLLYCEVYKRWADSFGYTPSELFAFVSALGYSDARVIREGEIYPLRLDRPVPENLFATSSDVLFFAAEHLERVERFDRRYNVVP